MLSKIASTLNWNSDNKHTLIKVIHGLLKGNLMDTIEKDYQRLLKGGNEHYMKQFYEAAVKLNETLPFDENSELYLREIEQKMFPSDKTYKDELVGEILQDNYNILKENNLLADYLQEFYSYFRGNLVLVCIHRVPDSDIIIFECKQKPFSNEKQYHWNEPDLKKFYSSKNASYVWDTFNNCLISSLFPQHYAAVIALLEVEENNSKNRN